MSLEKRTYASRAGQKLEAALDAFGLDITGLICADLGCSTGGFTDCLLQHGAGHVYSVDTAYGELAWKLRQDPRVTVLERSNALHLEPAAACDLVTIDLGWTPQRLAVPAAARWLGKSGKGRIISLIKPHYEAPKDALRGAKKGTLDDAVAETIKEKIIQDLDGMEFTTLGCIESPVRGGKGGNREYLAHLIAR
jgi:23S rRNA (cytidine1920-2'-O)/16S rRNA (cytidine1409-2'-O)-methyltransferase